MSVTPRNPLVPGLYIVATPIGNLGDITDRAKMILAAADVVACEDTRVAGKLLSLLGIKRPLLRHDDHADDAARERLIERMATEIVVLVSDAGTPLISDPGYRLVRAARAAGRMVTAAPGPCAAIMALTITGLPTDRFLFAGFLPAKTKARDDAIAELASIRATLVFYESGPRLRDALAALDAGLGPRVAAVTRELTKLHEECATGTFADLLAHFTQAPRGEIVIVVGPPQANTPLTPAPADIDAALLAALETGSAARAAKAVAASLSIPREAASARALVLTGKR